MKLLLISEVYRPENFIINDVVDNLFIKYFEEVIIITRVPTYPKGILYEGFKNRFSCTRIKNVTIIRYPVFTNYNKYKFFKFLNLLWQPIITLILTLTIRFDKLFVYQTGSIYSYSLIPKLLLRDKLSVIWSQDLWPEVGYEFGFPKLKFVDFFLRLITKKTLMKFDKIIVQGDGFQTYYHEKYKLESDVVYNFSNYELNKTTTKNKLNKTLVYCGNIGSLQNLEGLIKLYLNLKPYKIFSEFKIYGHGSLFEYYCDKYDNFNGISFGGQISQMELINELEICRFACLSLISGPIEYTIPGRFQFLFNQSVPILFLGEGVVKLIINREKCGVSTDGLDLEKLIIDINNFEKNKTQNKDIFSEKNTLKSLKFHLDLK
tara:strand:+ start:1889 stop:3016 length:1128 start_codon:yes stop_codon:yes gene_type:complete